MTKAYRHDGGAGSAWVAQVGERLRWAREICADNQSQAAKLLGADQSTFSLYERGERMVSIAVALRACSLWGLSLDYLYRGLIGGSLRRDVEVRLVARHPELVGAGPEALAHRAKEAVPAA